MEMKGGISKDILAAHQAHEHSNENMPSSDASALDLSAPQLQQTT